MVSSQQEEQGSDVTRDTVVAKETGAAKEIASKLEQLALDVASTQMLIGQIEGAASVDRDALSHWRDTRSLGLLSAVDVIAKLVVDLPDTDPMRLELEERMLRDFRWLGRSVYERIDQLDLRILEATSALELKEGAELANADSVLNNLENTRDSFLRAMVAHVETRKLLSLSMEHVLPPLKQRLLLQGESVAGRLVFASAMMEDLNRRLALDEESVDLLVVLNQAGEWHKHNLDRLKELVQLMGRLDMPQADYRSLIVKESGGLSVDMIRPDVMKTVVSTSLKEAKDFSLSRGPDILLNVLVFLGILLLFRMLSKFFKRRVELSLGKSNWDISVLLKDTLVNLSGFVVMLIGLLLALAQVGISLGPMLAGLGIAGFIVGIALQDTLANFASGAMILMYRPYDVEDFVEVPGAAGVVKKMTLVSTTITTFDNQTLVVPNRKIWGDVIKNVTAQRVRRVDLQFAIGYNEDIERAEKLLAAVAEAHELVLNSPGTQVNVGSLGDSGVNILLRPWVKTEDYWVVYWDITREVKLRFDQAGIKIPFQQRDIHVYNHSDRP